MAHMEARTMATLSSTYVHEESLHSHAHAHGVSWPAVIAGAFVAAALSLILLALGAGAGLSSLSPWSNAEVMPSAVKIGALIWVMITEIVSASVGGYLAGRLRSKWIGVHTDEVYFRDTAHGFLVWAVALVVAAAFLGSAASAMVGVRARGGERADESQMMTTNQYYVTTLFRSSQAPSATQAEAQRDVGGVFAHALRERQLSDEDKSYAAGQVAAVTGLNQADAVQRVSDTFERDQQAEDAARKAAAHGLYWLFVAALLGAFCASVAGLMGGRQRDRVRV
jgi:hypothetical protein